MSIKKIAEQVGVSPSTVSRVLGNPNYHCSSEELRDKIWKAAIAMNYTPNQAARNLRLKKENDEEKTYYINILMTRMDFQQTDPFFSELLRVVESEIHKYSCILTKIWYEPFFSNDRKCCGIKAKESVERLYAETDGKNDGLIIIGKCSPDALDCWTKKYKNIVSINRNSTNYQVDEVLCDGKKIASIAVEHLVSLGHKEIGYVGQCHKDARYKGFLSTLQKYNLDVNPHWVIEAEAMETAGYEAMDLFEKMEEQPTAIYCANDIIAVGLLKFMKKGRRRFYTPSVIASDDIEAAQNCSPMLTTVSLPKDEMGKFALFLLVDRMKGGHKVVTRLELEGKLMLRNSCTVLQDNNWSDYCI